MKKELKCAVIGLGQRGSMLLDSCLIPMARDEKQPTLSAVCDIYPDRTKEAADKIEAAG